MTICKSPPTRNVAWLILLGLALALQFTAGMAQAQTVTTDQADYPPGSTVYITGSGFAAGEIVTNQVLTITQPNDDTRRYPPASI